MKISEMTKQLKEIQDKDGDMDVVIEQPGDFDLFDIKNIRVAYGRGCYEGSENLCRIRCII